MKASARKSKSSEDNGQQRFLFVNQEIGAKGSTRESRSHVGRVNRRRKKNEEIEKSTTKTASPSTSASSSNHEQGVYLTEGQADGAGRSDSQVVLASRTRAAQHRNAHRGRAPTALTLSPTPSPVFGAYQTNTSRLESDSKTMEIVRYCFGKDGIMDSWQDPPTKEIWFFAFREHYLVRHTLSYTCGMLLDIDANRPIQTRRLVDKLETIKLVREQCEDIENVDIEPLLLAIISLWRVERDTLLEHNVPKLLFKPHTRSSSWVDRFGRLGGDGTHRPFLVALISRLGGLRNNFKTLPGLQESIALADILDASSRATKPNFPDMHSMEDALQRIDTFTRILDGDVEGSGFANGIARNLPGHMLRGLQGLAVVDKLLDNYTDHNVTDKGDFPIALLSNTVQHRLLSLTPWQELEEADRDASSEVIYETCRITSVIYSTSVILPMAPGEPWLMKLLSQFKTLLETSDPALWDDDAVLLRIWSLCIAGIAALSTAYQNFFVERLRSTLLVQKLTSWLDAKVAVEQFLWRDKTCDEGAEKLWEILEQDGSETQHNMSPGTTERE